MLTMIRTFLILALILPLLNGCETAWGGDPNTSLKELNAKQTQSVDDMEQQGQVTKAEADAMRESIDGAGSPAGM